MARKIWNNLSREALARLTELVEQYKFSVATGDLMYLDNGWYVTHTGLLGLARRSHCAGIHVQPVPAFCDAVSSTLGVCSHGVQVENLPGLRGLR